MANVIYLSFNQPGLTWLDLDKLIDMPLICPLLEDPSLDLSSEFMSFNDLIPGELGSIITFAQNLHAVNGQTTPGMVNLSTLLSTPKWSRTNPITLALKLVFYTETNPCKDVWLPITELCNLAIIKQVTKTNPTEVDMINGKDVGSGIKLKQTYLVPGMNLRDASQGSMQTALNSAKGKDGKINVESKEAKGIADTSLNQLLTVFIPGIIYLNAAMVESARPTFSKQVTASGFPLWGELELNIKSLEPANSTMFDSVKIMTNDFSTSKLKNTSVITKMIDVPELAELSLIG